MRRFSVGQRSLFLLAAGGLIAVPGVIVPALAQGIARSQTASASASDAMRQLSQLAGGVWVGRGTLEGLGTYRSERRFSRAPDGSVVSTHIMLVGDRVLGRDSTTIRSNAEGVARLEAVDQMGRVTHAVLRTESPPGRIIFENSRWRAEYSRITRGNFTLEFSVRRENVWVSHLRTEHRRGGT